MCERLYNVCIQLIITMNQMWSNVRRVLRTMHNYNRLRFKARNDLIKQVHFGKSHQFFFVNFTSWSQFPCNTQTDKRFWVK